MRHNVGDKLLTIQFKIEGDTDGSFVLPFLYNHNPVEEIRLIWLTVKEHHKVKGEWDKPEADPKYDGYILEDAEGRIWYNQYPYASYGQLSDDADRRFSLHLNSAEEYCAEPFYETLLLTDVISKIERTIKELNQISEPQGDGIFLKQELPLLLISIADLLKQQGFEIGYKSVFKYDPNIKRAIIVPIDTGLV